MRRPNPTVLLVEDDAPTRDLYRTSLRLADFNLRVAATGLAALREIDDDPPDLIVLDLDLPLVSGIEIHDELGASERTADIPVVVVTGTDWRPRHRPTVVLTKPINPEQLVEVIRRILRGRPRGMEAGRHIGARSGGYIG